MNTASLLLGAMIFHDEFAGYWVTCGEMGDVGIGSWEGAAVKNRSVFPSGQRHPVPSG